MNMLVIPANQQSIVQGGLSVLAREEIDMQITTAKRYPRDIIKARKDIYTRATITQDVAQACFYRLERKNKNTNSVSVISGESVRFAEILLQVWGNCRVATRIIDENAQFVIAQAVFFDLENNTSLTIETQRSIVGKSGRFGVDMIAVTGSAARSIALRDVVLRSIPRGLWQDLSDKIREFSDTPSKGPAELYERVQKCIAYFDRNGVSQAQIEAKIGVKVDKIKDTELSVLRGIINAVNEGETTFDQEFGTNEKALPPAPPPPPAAQSLEDRLKNAVRFFDGNGVNVERIEKKIRRKISEAEEKDMDDLSEIANLIKDGKTTFLEQFPIPAPQDDFNPHAVLEDFQIELDACETKQDVFNLRNKFDEALCKAGGDFLAEAERIVNERIYLIQANQKGGCDGL
jgi:hypothetical protein